VPAVVLPAQPPKNSFGVAAAYPQLDQLQKLPSGSEPLAVHTRIGCPEGHKVPTVAETEQALLPEPEYRRLSLVQ
jgi:hypothetical protein